MPKRTTTSDVIDTLLVQIAFGGMVAATIVAPNGLKALQKPLQRLVKRRNTADARRIATYLKQQRLVTVSRNDDDSYTVELTQRGRRRAVLARFDQLTIDRSKWDQKWRLVMFDIPESKKVERNFISRHLRQIGFKPLQRSVFVFPYPVDEFMALLNEIFPDLSPYMLHMTVADISNHNQLVKQFSPIL